MLDQTPKDIDTLNRMYTILGNIERIGDHAMNLAEYAETIKEKDFSFPITPGKEFAVMEETCREGMELFWRQLPGTRSPRCQRWLRLSRGLTISPASSGRIRLTACGRKLQCGVLHPVFGNADRLRANR